MPIVTWTDKLSVGVREFDMEHQQLVALLNRLYDAVQSGQGKDALGGVLDGLTTYVGTHFAHEEEIMEALGFPGLAAHRAEHQALTAGVDRVRREFEQSATLTLSTDVLKFLWQWLAKHIMVTDKGYSDFLRSKGVT